MFLHFHVHVLLRLALPLLSGCFPNKLYPFDDITLFDGYSDLHMLMVVKYFFFPFLVQELLQSATGHFLRISSSGTSI